MKERQSVNYIYYGILFLVLSILHIYHVFLIEETTPVYRFFYSVYALMQCALEVGAVIVIGHLLTAKFPKTFNTLFVVLTLVLFLIHVVDFPLVRIMGMSIWYALDFIRDESLQNFMELIYATHTPLILWVLGAVAVMIIPLLGILFFRATNQLAGKKPVYFSYSALGMGLFSALFFLSMFDFKTHEIATPADDGKFLQVLPWKTTFFSSANPRLQIGHLSSGLSEGKYHAELEAMKLTAVKKPNIFLFVTESLREDFITRDIAPALVEFKKNNSSFKHSLSGANATHISWFSIFHSVYPFYWKAREPSKWQSGSLPLQILKKAGYQIRLYSASRLSFYQLQERLFGKGHQLADSYQVFGEDEGKENHENDAACIAALTKDLSSCRDGHLFIVFLESTHFGYSWPQQETINAAPDGLDFFNLTCSNNQIDGIKNRYRNAIHFIDKLFGQFIEKLKSVPGGQEAVVVFTGDHGEEFFEEERIFHASNLNTMQTHVPLYLRLGSGTPLGQREIASHLDIFPTILEHVLGHQRFESWFDGESLLHASKKNFAISTRYNANRCPFEFLIHNGKNQMVVRFDDKSDIFKSRALEIISQRDEEGASLEIELDQVRHDFKSALETLFTINPIGK